MKLIWCTLEFCYRHIIMYRCTCMYACTTKNLYKLCDCLRLTARKDCPQIVHERLMYMYNVFHRVWKRKPSYYGHLFDLATLSRAFLKLQQELYVGSFIFHFNVTCYQVNNSFKANLFACFFCCIGNSHSNFELYLLSDMGFREK